MINESRLCRAPIVDTRHSKFMKIKEMPGMPGMPGIKRVRARAYFHSLLCGQ